MTVSSLSKTPTHSTQKTPPPSSESSKISRLTFSSLSEANNLDELRSRIVEMGDRLISDWTQSTNNRSPKECNPIVRVLNASTIDEPASSKLLAYLIAQTAIGSIFQTDEHLIRTPLLMKSAMEYYIHNPNAENFKTVLYLGGSINTRNSKGSTPIQSLLRLAIKKILVTDFSHKNSSENFNELKEIIKFLVTFEDLKSDLKHILDSFKNPSLSQKKKDLLDEIKEIANKTYSNECEDSLESSSSSINQSNLNSFLAFDDVNTQDEEGNTPLHCLLKKINLCENEKCFEEIQSELAHLIEKKPDFNILNKNQDTPITQLIRDLTETESVETAKNLIKALKFLAKKPQVDLSNPLILLKECLEEDPNLVDLLDTDLWKDPSNRFEELTQFETLIPYMFAPSPLSFHTKTEYEPSTAY